MNNRPNNNSLLQENLERLKNFRLLDDTYARTYFRKHPELAEFVLRIITGIDDLTVDPAEYETQYDAKRIAGSRSIIMDVVAGDTSGRKFNLEVENWNAEPERGEYHVATMCVENLKPKQVFKDLPEIYVIFICDGDSIGNGLPVNKFSYRNDSSNESLNGKTHIIYVNGQYEDDQTDIGKLIHDFKCDTASQMHFKNLADRTRYLKEDPKGVREMCKIMDDMIKDNVKENSTNIAVKLLQIGNDSHEQIAEATGLSLDEVKKLAGQAAS